MFHDFFLFYLKSPRIFPENMSHGIYLYLEFEANEQEKKIKLKLQGTPFEIRFYVSLETIFFFIKFHYCEWLTNFIALQCPSSK